MAELKFDSKKPEDWDRFLRRFQITIDGKGNIPDSQKRGMLLNALDDRTLDRLEKWLEPVPLESASYSAALAILKEHLQTKTNNTVKYVEFTGRHQLSGESAATYMEELSRIVPHLGIEDKEVRELLCMHQFVAGLQDKALQDKLFEAENLTMESALGTAIQTEANRRMADAVRRPAESNSVYRVGPQHDAGARQPVCYCCAGAHLAKDCPEDKDKLFCSYCKIKRHVLAACKKWKKAQQQGKGGGGSKREKQGNNTRKKPSGNVASVETPAQAGPSAPPVTVPPTPLAVPSQPVPQAQHVAAMHTPTAARELYDLVYGHQGLFQVGAAQALRAAPPVMLQVRLNGTDMWFQVDSGACRTIIGSTTFEALAVRPSLRPADIELHRFEDPKPIVFRGVFDAEVHFRDRRLTLPVLVSNGNGPSLLGRDWFAPMGLGVSGVNSVSDFNDIYSMVKEYPTVSSPHHGCFTGPPVHIAVPADAQPRYQACRRVPFPLMTKMEEAIDKQVAQGVWVPYQDYRWASAIVPVAKKNGSLRLCADYKGTVNPFLSPDTYRTPTVDEVLHKLAGGQIFGEIDLVDAYTQIPVDEDTSKLLAVNTIKGLFRVTRMPFGVKVASAVFQRVIDSILSRFKGVVAYQDNVYIKADNLSAYKQILCSVLQALSEAGLKVNADKCTWATTELNVLGFKITPHGLHPLEDKVIAIHRAPVPKGKGELLSLLGLITFYGRFFKGRAHVLEPLHRLLEHGAPWDWTDAHDAALQEVKKRITSDQVLVHYSLDRPVTITVDASPVGVGAVLSHTFVDEATGLSEERPIAFASRTLTPAERRYAQFDREAVAVMFGVKRFGQEVRGRFFRIVTDHKPLLGVFKPNVRIPDTLSPRMLRWVLTLGAMDYSIEHHPGPSIGNADFLSRLPLQGQADPRSDAHVHLVAGFLSRNPAEASQLPMYPDPAGVFLLDAKDPQDLSAAAIAAATLQDPLLSQVYHWTVHGWPRDVPPEAQPYAALRDQLSTLHDCLLRGDRVVVPHVLQPKVVELVHATHPGITCSKAIARAIVWWPGIDKDVENAVRQCTACQEAANRPPRTYCSWPKAEAPWERVHLDYAGPFMGHNFLIVIDAYSKWPVVKVVPDLSAPTLVTHMRYIFADLGLPKLIVTDNGGSFVAAYFQDFLSKNGVRHLFSPPWHPASNGLAERTVQSFKRLMVKFSVEADIHARVARVLWAMRTRPSRTTGRSPAELCLGRSFRSHLTPLHPKDAEHQDPPARVNPYKVGQPVWALKFRSKEKFDWFPGHVQECNGATICAVVLDNGEVLHAVPVNYMRPRVPAPPPVRRRQEPELGEDDEWFPPHLPFEEDPAPQHREEPPPLRRAAPYWWQGERDDVEQAMLPPPLRPRQPLVVDDPGRQLRELINQRVEEVLARQQDRPRQEEPPRQPRGRARRSLDGLQINPGQQPPQGPPPVVTRVGRESRPPQRFGMPQ